MLYLLKDKKYFKDLTESSQGKLLLGRQSLESLNGAVMSAGDKDISDHYVNQLFNFAEQKNYLHNWGDFGPSFLTNCSNCIDLRKLIITGPSKIDIINAVIVPPIVLTVKYLNTSKPGSTETSAVPKYSNIYKPLHLHSSRAFN